ncbi:MAG: hypothetical protein GXO34_07835, partial [Deltaproteobacteria bacterium]|nr:hypothetical protein [Deltaproteobacteria bacterium]
DLEARRQVALIHARSFAIDSYFEKLPEAPETEGEEGRNRAELEELKKLLRELAAQGVERQDFFQALIDLVAIHSEGFNNDEIRAVFQEASLEHHLEGRVLTPAFFGAKIAALHRRRQERSHQHL